MAEEVDDVLTNLVHRSMKQIMTNHARKCGATEEWLKMLEPMDSLNVYAVVYLLYGEPDCFEKLGKEAE